MTVNEVIKRCFDVVVSLVCLVVLSPIFLLISFLVYIDLGCPIFFVHERPGKDGVIFKLIKFRTMKELKDESGAYLPNHKRVTRFGRFLRSTSLDELPEMINVLKGEMSLVGPRPLLVEYLPLYNEFQVRRHEVKPGITGLAQINGRNCISWEKKFEYDVWYVDNHNIWLDIKILILTVIKVIKRENVNQSETVTMEKFRGGGNLN